MKGEEKKALSHFFNTAADYLSTGYTQNTVDYAFSDDEEISAENTFSTLPLAYQLDEDDNVTDDDSLAEIYGDIKKCSLCALSSSRINTVPGEGAENPLVMVIGEGPGADEDSTGRPFVGKAGQLLDKMLSSIGLYRDKNCYIANTVKCRPPSNREPDADEMSACANYLDRQIKLLKPLLILCAGKTAAKRLLNSGESLTRLRLRFYEYLNVPVLVTYHPSALLREESYKRPAWEDLKMLKAKLISLNGNI